MKNFLDGLSNYELADEIINKLEDNSIEIIQCE